MSLVGLNSPLPSSLLFGDIAHFGFADNLLDAVSNLSMASTGHAHLELMAASVTDDEPFW